MGQPEFEAGFAALLPSDAGTTRNRSFRTHAGYLRAIGDLALGTDWVSPESKLQALADRAWQAIPVGSGNRAMTEDLRGCLHRAWGTELILGTTQQYTQDPEVLRLANSWGAVQTYYVAHAATQALTLAMRQQRSNSHETVRKQFGAHWVCRSFNLHPWSIAVGHASVRGADAAGVLGAPPGSVVPGRTHPWLGSWTPAEALDAFATALRSTRQERLDDALTKRRKDKAATSRNAWEADEVRRIAAGKSPRTVTHASRKNLTRAESEAVDAATRPVYLIDYLYRLRVKANYEDAQMYSEGPDDDAAARDFMRSLVSISAANLLVHEVALSKTLARGVLAAEMRSWISRNADSGPETSIMSRERILNELT